MPSPPVEIILGRLPPLRLADLAAFPPPASDDDSGAWATVEAARRLARLGREGPLLRRLRALLSPPGRQAARRRRGEVIMASVGRLAAVADPTGSPPPRPHAPPVVAVHPTPAGRWPRWAVGEIDELRTRPALGVRELVETVNALTIGDGVPPAVVDDLLEAGLLAATLLRRHFPRVYHRRARRRPFTPVVAFLLCLLLTNLTDRRLFQAAWGDWWVGWRNPGRSFHRACDAWTMATVWSAHGGDEGVGLVAALLESEPALWGVGTAEEIVNGAADGGLLAWTVRRCFGDHDTDAWEPLLEAPGVIDEIRALTGAPTEPDAPGAALIRALNADAAPAPRLGDLAVYICGATGNPVADYSHALVDDWFGGVYEPHPWDDRRALREAAANHRRAKRLWQAYAALTERVRDEPALAVALARRILRARQEGRTHDSIDDA
jgi:hypothetical protein